jgi:hypothetical protein
MSTKTAKKVTTQQKSLKLKEVEEPVQEIVVQDSSKKSFTKTTDKPYVSMPNQFKYFALGPLDGDNEEEDIYDEKQLVIEDANFEKQNKENSEKAKLGNFSVPKINVNWVRYGKVSKFAFKLRRVKNVASVMYWDKNWTKEDIPYTIKFKVPYDTRQQECVNFVNFKRSVDQTVENFFHGPDNFLTKQGLNHKSYKNWNEVDIDTLIQENDYNDYTKIKGFAMPFAKNFDLEIEEINESGESYYVFPKQTVSGNYDIYKMIYDNCPLNKSMFSMCVQMNKISTVKANKKYSVSFAITYLKIWKTSGRKKTVEEKINFVTDNSVRNLLGINANKEAEPESEEETDSEEEYEEDESDDESPKKTLTKKN